MIDLSILPSRLPSVAVSGGVLTIERAHPKHAERLCEAAQASIQHVGQWLGRGLCPLTPAQARHCIEDLEKQRDSGYGITYLLTTSEQCLGMGFINYIHPLHRTANLGYWIRPEVCGKGLAVALANSLKKLAFSQMDLSRLELLIEPNNKASLRVAEKLKAVKEGVCRKRLFGRDALLYALTVD